MSRLWVKSAIKVKIHKFELNFRNFVGVCFVFVTFALWISAHEIREGEPFNEFPKNGTHWANCTIDGEIHYDEDCFGWIGWWFSLNLETLPQNETEWLLRQASTPQDYLIRVLKFPWAIIHAISICNLFYRQIPHLDGSWPLPDFLLIMRMPLVLHLYALLNLLLHRSAKRSHLYDLRVSEKHVLANPMTQSSKACQIIVNMWWALRKKSSWHSDTLFELVFYSKNSNRG
jgi:hypothetical protein